MLGLCVITQFADTPTYVRAIHHFSMYPLSVLLVPASGSAIWKANASASASRTTKRPKIWDDDQSESIPDETTNTVQKSGASILIRCLEDLHGIQAQPFHRKHWNYQEGKHASFANNLALASTDGPLTQRSRQNTLPEVPLLRTHADAVVSVQSCPFCNQVLDI